MFQFLDDLRLEMAREYEALGNHYAAYKEYEQSFYASYRMGEIYILERVTTGRRSYK